MAGREGGGGSTAGETMEEGRQHGEQERYQRSEDGGRSGSERCSGGNDDMISVQFLQKVMLLRACLLCMLLMFSVFSSIITPSVMLFTLLAG
jgi:hypothetical protein